MLAASILSEAASLATSQLWHPVSEAGMPLLLCEEGMRDSRATGKAALNMKDQSLQVSAIRGSAWNAGACHSWLLPQLNGWSAYGLPFPPA